jgi:hypothetical protein
MVTAPAAAELAAGWAADLAVILGPALVGVYLHGSLALGDYVPGFSDIDLLVVERGPVPSAVRRLVLRFWLERSGRVGGRGRGHHQGIEVSHVSWGAWRDGPGVPYLLHFSERCRAEAEEMDAAGRDPDPPLGGGRDLDLPAHMIVTAAPGIRLAGPARRTLSASVPASWYLASLASDFQDAPDLAVSTVLNACRTLRWLATGQVGSKTEGGRWMLVHGDATYHGLARRAVEARRQGVPFLDPDALAGQLREQAYGAVTARLDGTRLGRTTNDNRGGARTCPVTP